MFRIKISEILVLITLIAIGAFLRLVDLDTIPNGLYVDEASTGYNAYSVLLTGKDEYGKEFPLAFKFLGSYTPPLYTYLTSILFFLFGTSVFSLRLLSSLAGVLIIPLFYLLLREIKFVDNKFSLILATFLLAINPWSIFYSRIGYEVNLAFLFFSLGVFFLWFALSNMKLIIPSLIFFGLSVNTYQTEKLLVFLVLIVFSIIFYKKIFQQENLRHFVVGLIFFAFIISPQIYLLHTPAAKVRAGDLFWTRQSIKTAEDLKLLPSFISIPYFLIRDFSALYLTYFSPRSLFFQPEDDQQRSLPELSVFYPWLFVPFLIGLFYMIKKRSEANYKLLFLILFLSPIPAALTIDPFSTQRAMPLLLPIMIIIAIGIEKIMSINLKFGVSLIVFFSLISLLQLYRSYWILFPRERAVVWGYGFRQLAKEIETRPSTFFVIDPSRTSAVYIQLAFYLRIPPDIVQKSSNGGKQNYYFETQVKNERQISNFEIRGVVWEEDIYKQQILVGDELSISSDQAKEHSLEKAFQIIDPLSNTVFVGFKTNPAKKCQSERMKGQLNIKKCKDLVF